MPFHFWCPDVYQGAPTPVTAFLSVAPKAAGFAIMLRFFFRGFAVTGSGPWDLDAAPSTGRSVLMVISVVTMTVGNVAALTQTNMKRLLAYSSIAHAGYIMMGVVALSENGARALLVYLLAYLFMNLGRLPGRDPDPRPGRHLRPARLRRPLPARAVPDPGHGASSCSRSWASRRSSGFMGKLYVFAAIIEKGPTYAWYAVVGALNAAIAAYYYSRVLKTMIIDAEERRSRAFVLAPVDLALGAASSWSRTSCPSSSGAPSTAGPASR